MPAAVEGARRRDNWVLAIGGLTAFGWFATIAALVTGDLGAAALFFVVFNVPANIWWRSRLRARAKAADPEGFAADKSARRSSTWARNRSLASWFVRGKARQFRWQMKEDSRHPSSYTVEEQIQNASLFGGGARQRRPKMGAIPGSDQMAYDAGERAGSIGRAFFSPMPAALAEWRSRN